MNFKKYHVSKNLFDTSVLADGYHLDTTTGLPTQRGNNDRVATLTPIDVSSISAVTLSYLCTINDANFMYSIFDGNDTLLARVTAKHSGDSIDVSNAAKLYIAFYGNSAVTISSLSQVMLNTGSEPLPYEPYSSEVWHDTPHYIHNTSTDTITTPADIYANDTTVAVGLKGNMEQSGTPTPTTPIQPSECGERTAQLWDEQYLNGYYDSSDIFVSANNQICTKNKIPVKPNTVYWLGVNFSQSGFMAILKYDNTGTFIERIITSYYTGQGMLYTTDSNTYFIKINFSTFYGTTYNNDIMIAESQTPLPYEPYGIKIPILSNSQTTNVYLGEVQTTRWIVKAEFSGNEDWQLVESSPTNRFFNISLSRNNFPISMISSPSVSTHFNSIIFVSNGTIIRIYDNTGSFTTETDFKSYLAQQYANGTPVTIWYVLKNETTGIVNEPLRKIGDYADTVSGITIPTIAGANTIDIDTTLKPSEVSINYHGWHPVSAVHEKSKNLFNPNFTRYHMGKGTNNRIGAVSNGAMFCIKAAPNTNYTIKVYTTDSTFVRLYLSNAPIVEGVAESYNVISESETMVNPEVTISNTDYAYLWIQVGGAWYTEHGGSSIMLNSGSTALPYEPYWM